MNENTSYMAFVLGYDLLQEKLNELELPCDVAYKKCKEIYDSFLCSEEYFLDKSEYECLQDYIESHKNFINKMCLKIDYM